MTLRTVSFRVIGDPKGQGSKSAFVVNGRAVMKESGEKELRPWRNAIRDAAKAALAEHGEGCLVGPVAVRAVWRLNLPISRPAHVRQFGSCPCAVSPDLDKLQRALGDALTQSGLIEDDARIARWDVAKIEVQREWRGVVVQVRQMPDLLEVPEWAR